MGAISIRRVALGTIAGGVVWAIWSTVINMVFLGPRYAAAQSAGWLLAAPRYPLFIPYWIILLFVLTYILTWAYVSVRTAFGPGPITALRVGFLLGFMSAFPLSFCLATWGPFSRGIPLGWMLDLWGGAILATLVSASIYKES
jgi:hypothetical protein